MIDIRKLKELVRLMVDNELTEIDLRDNEEQVTLRRQSSAMMPTMLMPQGGHAMVPAPGGAHAMPSAASSAAGAVGDAPASADDGLVRIESPMVGTFYAAGTPDAPAFVSVGSSVSEDSTVCIIEAMKIFNEIKAERNGTIEKVLVRNGDAVEFGQPLFLVRPD